MDNMLQLSLFSTSPESQSVGKENECNVLHISDLHFGINAMGSSGKKAEYEKIMAGRQEVLFNSLIHTLKEKVPYEWKPDVIAISGDIAWSAKKEEYERFHQSFLEPLLEALNLKNERVIAVPGNHDIDRNYVARAGHRLVAPIKGKPYEEAHVDPITKDLISKELWHYFENFVQEFYPTDSGADGSLLCRKKTYEEWPWLHFLALNSAWDCRGNQDAGCLRVGLSITEQLIQELRETRPAELRFDGHGHISDTIVAIFHHPCIQVYDFVANDELDFVDWLHNLERADPKDRMCFRDFLTKYARIVLNGHIHKKAGPIYKNKSYHFFAGTFFSPEVPEFHCRIIKVKKGNEGVPPTLELTASANDGFDYWVLSDPPNTDPTYTAVASHNPESKPSAVNQSHTLNEYLAKDYVGLIFNEILEILLQKLTAEQIMELLTHYSEFFKSDETLNNRSTRRRNPD